MPVTRTGSDGRQYILEGGQFRPLTPDEERAAGMSGTDAFMAAGARNLSRIEDLINIGVGAAHGGGQQARNFGGALMENERAFDAVRQFQPGAALAGELILDPLNIPGGAIAKKVAGRIGGALVRETAQQTATRAARETIEAAGEATLGAGRMGDSVGAASVLDVIPQSIRAPIERTLDEVFVPGELSAQQRAALPIADNIGWQFLPGQRSGNTFASEIATSNPMIRDAFAYEMGVNRELLDGAGVRALGRQGDEMSFELLADGMDDLGREFDDIITEMEPIGFGEGSPLRETLTRLATDVADDLDLPAGNQASADLLRQLGREMDELPGETFQRLHSRWRDRASRAFRSADVEANEVAELYSRGVNALDEALLRSGRNASLQPRYRAVRERYRIGKVMERPGSLNRQTGNISPSVMWNNMRREYGRNFDRAQLRGASEELQRLVDTIKVARSFEDTLGDSGTASRMFLQQLAQNPKGFAGNLLLRELVKRRTAIANAAQ